MATEHPHTMVFPMPSMSQTPIAAIHLPSELFFFKNRNCQITIVFEQFIAMMYWFPVFSSFTRKSLPLFIAGKGKDTSCTFLLTTQQEKGLFFSLMQVGNQNIIGIEHYYRMMLWCCSNLTNTEFLKCPQTLSCGGRGLMKVQGQLPCGRTIATENASAFTATTRATQRITSM